MAAHCAGWEAEWCWTSVLLGERKKKRERECVHVCVDEEDGEEWWTRVVGGSQAVAVAVRERRFGQFHHIGSPLADDFGGTTQQLLGLCECFGELLLPLYELWIAL